MKKSLVTALLLFSLLSRPVLAQEEEEVPTGTIAALAAKSDTSDFQNWIFALGSLFSAAAGILLVSWEPGGEAH